MNCYLITIPITAGLITQAIKLATDGIKGNFTLGNLGDYGGMPSAHSAIVAALTTEMAITQGLASPYFAISFLFSLLILRDAKGLRNYVGKANAEINKLNKETGKNLPPLNERVGHSLLEIIIGFLMGIIIALWGVMYAKGYKI